MANATLEMSRCASCHAGFLPRPGACPRCGSNRIDTVTLPAHGTVRASTELWVPPTGWTVPHRLVLVEVDEGIRILCVATGTLPAAGETVQVVRDGPIYRIVDTAAEARREGTRGGGLSGGRSRPTPL